MKIAELNDLLYYNGQLHKVTGIAIGKMVIMEPIVDMNDKHKFVHDPGLCYPTIYVLEDSPNFQDGAEPIDTIHTTPAEIKNRQP